MAWEPPEDAVAVLDTPTDAAWTPPADAVAVMDPPATRPTFDPAYLRGVNARGGTGVSAEDSAKLRGAVSQANVQQTPEWREARRTEAVLADADPLARAPAIISEPYRGVAGAGASILSTVTRPFSKDTADFFAATGEQIAQTGEAARKDDWSPWLSRMYGGAVQSITQSGLAAATGAGAAGIIGSFALTEGNQALYDAEQAGLTGNDRLKYAAIQGAIEGTIATVFNKIGLGGQEKFIADAARGAMKATGKQFLKSTAQELPEELMTEVGHAVAEQVYGINPQATTKEQLGQRLLDTVAQTVMTMGLAHGAAKLTEKRQEVEALKQASVKGFVSERDGRELGLSPEEMQSRKTRYDAVRRKEAEARQELERREKEIQDAQEVQPEGNQVRPEPPAAEVAPEAEVQPVAEPTRDELADALSRFEAEIDSVPAQPPAEATEAAPPAPVAEAPPVDEARVQELLKQRGKFGNKRAEETARKDVAEEAELLRKYPPGTKLGIAGFQETFEVKPNGKLMASSGRWMGDNAGAVLRFYKPNEITVLNQPEAAPTAQDAPPASIDDFTPPKELTPREKAQQKQSPAEPFRMPADEVPAAKEVAKRRRGRRDQVPAPQPPTTPQNASEAKEAPEAVPTPETLPEAVRNAEEGRFADKSDAELRDIEQMYRENIATKKSNGQKVPAEWEQGLQEVRARLAGANPQTEIVTDSEIYGHPLNPLNAVGDKSLIPIKLNAGTDLSWRIADAQKAIDELQTRIGRANAEGKRGKKSAYLGTQNARDDAQRLEGLRQARDYLGRLQSQQKSLQTLPEAVQELPGELGAVYQTSFRGRKRFAVRESLDKRGFGDSLFDTKEEAERQGELVRRRASEREAAKKAADEKAELERQAKAEAEDLDGFAADASPMQRGRIVKALGRSVKFRGKATSKRDMIRTLVAEGRRLEGDRLLNEQDEFIQLDTKAERDYAQHLIGRRAVSETAPDRTETDIISESRRKSLRTNETSPGETDTYRKPGSDTASETPQIATKELWQMTRSEAQADGWGDSWTSVIRRADEQGRDVPQVVRDELAAYDAEKAAKRKPREPEMPKAKLGDTVVRYTHKDGTGLLNNSGLDRSKLTDDQEAELVRLMDFGLTQPGNGVTGTFYFTKEGEQKHKRMLTLLKKASKSGVVRTESVLASEPTWQSDDGQLAAETTTPKKRLRKPKAPKEPQTAKKSAGRKALAPTDMMKRYQAIKQEVPDSLLLMRTGDFYELMYDDAVTAAKTLGLTITTRGKGKNDPDAVPMTGFPYHQLDGYLAKLMKEGHKAAVVEDVDPKQAKGVRREVTRVVTPGTMDLLPPTETAEQAEVTRVVEKLLEWKAGERLTDPENFSSSWAGYDDSKRKAIVRELVDRGELPIGFDRKKLFGLREFLDNLTTRVASARYKTPDSPAMHAMDAMEGVEWFDRASFGGGTVSILAKGPAGLTEEMIEEADSRMAAAGFAPRKTQGDHLRGTRHYEQKTKLQQAASAALDDAKSELDELGKAIRKKGLPSNPFLDPDLVARSARVVYKFAKAGGLKFAVLVEKMTASIGQKHAQAMEPVMRAEWNKLQATGEFPDMEPADEPPRATTGTKHAKTDELREKAGLEERQPAEREAREQWEREAADRIAADPEYARKLAEQVVAKPEPLDKIENAAIGQYIQDLENRRNDGEDVFEELATATEASVRGGAEAGRALGSRRGERYADFSLAGLVAQYVGSVNAQPSIEQMEQFAEQADRIKELEGELQEAQQKLAQAEVDKAIAEAQAASGTAPPPAKRGTKRQVLQQKAADAVANFKEKWAALRQVGAIADPKRDADKLFDVTTAAVEVVKAYSELGVNSFLEFLSRVKKDIGQITADQKETFRKAWGQVHPKAEAPELDPASLGVLARKLTRFAVESGITERDVVVDTVHEELQGMGFEVSRSDTMAAISGYGNFRELSKDAVSIKVRGISGELQQLLKLEDMQAGQAPKKSGVERRDPTDEERRLIKLVNEAKKRGGYTVTDPARQLKSALTAAKTAARNRITDLEQAIAKRERIVSGQTKLTPDAELTTLQKQRDELNEEYRTIFPAKKGGFSDASRLKAAEKLLDRQITDLQADLAAGRLDAKAKGAPLSSPEIEEKKRQLEQLKATREQARAASPEYQAREAAKQNARYKQSLQRQLALWETRRDEAARGILPQKRKPTPLDKEMLETKFQIEQVKRETQAMIEEAARAARSKTGKALGFGGDLLDLSRAVWLGLELSPILLQGAPYTYGYPIKAARAIMDASRAAVSRTADFAIHDKLMQRPNHADYLIGEIETTASEGPLSHREEFIRSRIVSWLASREGTAWTLPRVAGEVLLGFERWVRTFMNTMRADLFDFQKASIEASRPGTWSEDDAKIIGNASNVFSGRGKLPFGMSGVSAGRVFLAPRWVWSRAQLLVGQPLWKGDKATRLAVGKVYVRAALGYGAAELLRHVIYSLLADDEDDKPKYELDPRSSDFGKRRLGETRTGTNAGLSTLMVLGTRLAKGETKLSDGRIVPIRGDDVPFGADDSFDLMARFGRSKLAPLPSGVIDWIVGKDIVGKKATVGSIIAERVSPMTWGDIYDAERELGVKQGTVAALDAFIGNGVSTYGDRTRYRDTDEAGRKEIVERDLKHLSWADPDRPAYAEFLTEDQLSKYRKQLEKRKQSLVVSATVDAKTEDSIAERDKAAETLRQETGWTKAEAIRLLRSHYADGGKITPDENKSLNERIRKLNAIYGD